MAVDKIKGLLALHSDRDMPKTNVGSSSDIQQGGKLLTAKECTGLLLVFIVIRNSNIRLAYI
jgi:hypothetical protein